MIRIDTIDMASLPTSRKDRPALCQGAGPGKGPFPLAGHPAHRASSKTRRQGVNFSFTPAAQLIFCRRAAPLVGWRSNPAHSLLTLRVKRECLLAGPETIESIGASISRVIAKAFNAAAIVFQLG